MLLVIGGTGYLGSALVAELVRHNERVRVTIRDPGRAEHVLPEEVERVGADLDDEPSLHAAMTGCSGVFLVAGIARDSAAETLRSNVDATARVLRAAEATGVRRIVFTSTTATITDANGYASEDATGEPAVPDPYVRAKAASERLLRAAADRGQETVILNPASIYGPSPRGPRSYNALLLAAARGELTEIVDAEIGWVLAADVAIGHLLAYRHGVAGQRYLLCGEVASFGRLLNTYAELAGSPHRVTALPPGSSLGPDAGLLARRSEMFGRLGPVRIDDTFARAIGFAPHGIDEGLRRTERWLSHRKS